MVSDKITPPHSQVLSTQKGERYFWWDLSPHPLPSKLLNAGRAASGVGRLCKGLARGGWLVEGGVALGGPPPPAPPPTPGPRAFCVPQASREAAEAWCTFVT